MFTINVYKIRVSILFLLLLIVPSIIYGQVSLTNPGFPEKETVVYSQITDSKLETVNYTMEYKNIDNKIWMEYRFFSRSRDVFIKLNPDNLNVFYSETWDRLEDSSLHSFNEVFLNSKQVEEGELLITDMEGFLISLRGFPWEDYTSARIVFLNRTGGFSPELKVKGKETLKINNISYECWKVQLGMKGILGAVFPKSYFWFSAEPPHYLVRSETAGMPGNPQVILEIQSYALD